MNKRNLALLISKHPLIELLKKDKTLPNSVVARLIAEELMEAPKGDFYAGKKGELGYNAKKGMNKKWNQAKKTSNINELQKFIELYSDGKNPYGKFNEISTEIQQVLKKYGSFLVAKAQEQIGILQAAEQAKNTADQEGGNKTQQAQQKLDKEVAAAAQKVTQTLEDPEAQGQPEEYERLYNFEPSEEWLSNLNLTTKTVGLTEPQLKDFAVLVDKLIKKSKQSIPANNEFTTSAMSEANGEFSPFNDSLAIVKNHSKPISSEEAQAVREFLKEHSTNPEAASQWVNAFFSSLASPEEEEEDQEKASPDVVDTVTKNAEEEIDKNPVDQEDVRTVVAAETEEVVPEETPEKKAEIEKQVLAKLSSPEKKSIEFSDEQKESFISAATKFEQEFYNQRLLLDQAKLIKAVIDSMKELQEDPTLARSFGKRPKSEPEPETVAEEQDEKVKADQKELQNLRVDFRSFLQRVNKSSKVLAKFEKAATDGKVISDKYKKQFMKILAELQESIRRIVRDLQQILPQEQKLTEIEESEIMKKWDEVEKRYDLAVQSVNGLKELINGETTEENPQEVINDAFKTLIDLSQDFPSVNPFNVGVKTPADFVSYQESFKSAVAGVKSSLQNVLSLIKSSVGGEDSLRLAMSGLKEFSGQIQSIFGVASQFKDVQVQPNEEAAKETSPENPDTETPQDPTSNIDQEFNEQLRRLTSEQIAAFLYIENPVFRNTFLRLVANSNEFTQKLADVIKRIGDEKTQAQIITAMTKEVSIAPELIEDLKTGFVKAAKGMPTMIDLEGSLESTLERLKSEDSNTYNELKNIASDEETEDLLAVIKDVDDKDQFINQIIDGPKRQELEKYLASSEANQTLSDFLIKIKNALESDENIQEIEIRRRTKGGALKVFLEKLAAYLSGDLGDVTVEKLTDLWNEDDWANKEGKKALIDAYRIPLFADPELTGSVIRKAVQKTFPESNFEDEEGDWNQEEYDEEEEEEIDDGDINFSDNNEDNDISDFVDQDETGLDKDEEEDTENTEDKQEELELKIRAELKELVDGKAIDLWYFVDPNTNENDLDFYEPKEKRVPIGNETKDIMGDRTSGDDNAEGYYDLAAYMLVDGSYAEELSMTYQHDARGAEQILKRIKKFRTENPIGDGEEDVEESLSPELRQRLTDIEGYIESLSEGNKWIRVERKPPIKIQATEISILYSEPDGKIKEGTVLGWPELVIDPEMKETILKRLKNDTPSVYVILKSEKGAEYARGKSLLDSTEALEYIKKQFKKTDAPEFKMGVQEQLANKLKPLIKEMLNKGNKK